MSRHATFEEQTLINALLKAHTVELPDGTYRYVKGSNDKSIARRVSKDLSPSSIATFRKSMDPPRILKKLIAPSEVMAPAEADDDSAMQRVSVVEKRQDTIERRLDELLERLGG